MQGDSQNTCPQNTHSAIFESIGQIVAHKFVLGKFERYSMFIS